MSSAETADHTLHPRHHGVCPPCPAERAEALDLVKSLEAAQEAYERAALAMAKAAEDASVLQLWEQWSRRDSAHPQEIIEGWIQTCRDTSYLIDADKLADLKKLAGA